MAELIDAICGVDLGGAKEARYMGCTLVPPGEYD